MVLRLTSETWCRQDTCIAGPAIRTETRKLKNVRCTLITCIYLQEDARSRHNSKDDEEPRPHVYLVKDLVRWQSEDLQDLSKEKGKGRPDAPIDSRTYHSCKGRHDTHTYQGVCS